MKLKEINRTAIQSWSPAQQHPIYLATGTSAQQLDASFSTNASLELFELDLSDPSLNMRSCGSYSSSHRYHKLVWGPCIADAQDHPAGLVIAGGENGNVILYDATKIMAGESEAVVAESDRHTGPVRGLDVNPFQTNLFASGGNESEIYIWDINNFESPMTPGPKTQPVEDISCVAWNRQVQHILASASPSGRASVWDFFVDPQFGGKLVSLENGPANGQQPGGPRLVHVSQVVTEATFLTRSEQLQGTLSAGTFQELKFSKCIACSFQAVCHSQLKLIL